MSSESKRTVCKIRRRRENCLFHKGLEKESTSRLVHQTQVLSSQERPLSVWSETEGNTWHSFQDHLTLIVVTLTIPGPKHTPEEFVESEDLCLNISSSMYWLGDLNLSFHSWESRINSIVCSPNSVFKSSSLQTVWSYHMSHFSQSSWILDILAQSLSLRVTLWLFLNCSKVNCKLDGT